MAEPQPRRVYLHSISHVYGDTRPLASVPGIDAAQYALLGEDIETYCESGLPVWQLAARCARATLELSAARPDALLYAAQNEHDTGSALPALARELDLPDVDSIALSGHDCGNFAPALAAAADAVLSGRRRRVLLIVADRARPGERLMANGLSVFSDGAAACLVGAEPPGRPGFLVDAIVNRTEVPGGQETADAAILSTVRLAQAGTGALLRATGLERADFSHLVLPNYRIPSQVFLAAAMGFTRERLLFGAVRSRAHCFSADALITLGEQGAAGALAAGERIVTGGGGPHSWSCVALTRTP